MAETPIDDRRFTDDEVREILRKAVEKAVSRKPVQSAPTGLTRPDGLSLAELKAIAAEVGIDAGRVDDAARAVVQGAGTRPNGFLGGARIQHFERTVTGEFDRAGMHEMVSQIRRILGHKGEVSEIGGALEWSAKGETAERHVSVWSSAGRTTIQASANLTNGALITYLPAGAASVVVSLIGLGVAANGNLLGLILAATAPVAYGVLRTIFKRVTRSEAARLERTVEELARLRAGPTDPSMAADSDAHE